VELVDREMRGVVHDQIENAVPDTTALEQILPVSHVSGERVNAGFSVDHGLRVDIQTDNYGVRKVVPPRTERTSPIYAEFQHGGHVTRIGKQTLVKSTVFVPTGFVSFVTLKQTHRGLITVPNTLDKAFPPAVMTAGVWRPGNVSAVTRPIAVKPARNFCTVVISECLSIG